MEKNKVSLTDEIETSKNKKSIPTDVTNGDCVCFLNWLNNHWENGLKNINLAKVYLNYVGELPTNDDTKTIEVAKSHYTPQYKYNNKLIELLENPPEILVYLIPVDEKQKNTEIVVSRYKPSKK